MKESRQRGMNDRMTLPTCELYCDSFPYHMASVRIERGGIVHELPTLSSGKKQRGRHVSKQ